jgi:hypothetical protein
MSRNLVYARKYSRDPMGNHRNASNCEKMAELALRNGDTLRAHDKPIGHCPEIA